MSGFEVMGLISAIISIIDMSAKVYSAIENSSQLPDTFKDAAYRLPLAHDTLSGIELRLRSTDIEDATFAAIKGTVESCKDKAERLQQILEDLAAQPDAKRLDRYVAAIKRLGKEGKVEVLMKGLFEDVQLLAANQAIKAVSEERLKEILKAIEDLTRFIHASSDGDLFTHYGTGDMFNNSGGTQYNYQGSGDMNSAHTMYIRK